MLVARRLSILSLCALFLTASLAVATPNPKGTHDLADILPGEPPIGALIDLQRFLADLPELAEEGFVAEQIDALVARGLPDPREKVSYLALASRVGKPDGIREGVALAAGSDPLVPVIRELAAENGIPLTERAYRGVLFVTGVMDGKATRFADLTEGTALLGYDVGGTYGLSDRAVDTLLGQAPSFRDRHGHGLDVGTYLTARVILSNADRDAVAGTRLENLKHIKGVEIDVWQEGGKVRLELRARATSTLKAMFAIGILRKKLEQVAEQSTEPAVKRLLLQQTELNRRGAVLMMDTASPRDDFVVGVLALQELLR